MIELHLNRLISDESSFEKINGKFSKGGAEIRVEEMASILQEVQNQLPRDDRLLQELHWYIPLLSCSEDKIAMKIMQISLERFKEKVENLVQNLEKWQGKHEKRSDQQLNKTIQSLQELINGPYVNAICSLHKKILDGEAVDAEILFSVDELKELDFFLVPRGVLSAATSAQNPDSASISSMFNNMYKSTLALLQPFAAQAASYRYQSATNYDQVRKQDLLRSGWRFPDSR